MNIVVARQPAIAAAEGEGAPLKENEFRIGDVQLGSGLLIGDVAVFSVEGRCCSTQAMSTHPQAPSSEGTLAGSMVTCPWYGSQFNVCTGTAMHGPAKEPLATYRVAVDGEMGCLDVPAALAVPGA